MRVTEVKKRETVKKNSKKDSVPNNLINRKNNIIEVDKSISDNKDNIEDKNNKDTNKNIISNREIKELDEYLFHEGRHIKAYEFMGAHFVTEKRRKGVRFTTWAPKASKIVVVGDFSEWKIKNEYEMKKFNSSGLWTIFIPGLQDGMKYKFAITSQYGDTVLKSDPYAFCSEVRPNTASILVSNHKYRWADKKWLNKREKNNVLSMPMNIYEIHLGSWKTNDGEFMTYEELSEILPKYLKEMGYTHVELMPLNEHPLDASWGYQATSYYSVTSRYGNLTGLKKLINELHKESIGVILDWVPGHFCKDQHGLYMFDGTPTYEYEAFWKANNAGWGTNNFDLGKSEVKTFLISNAMYWINEFHIDGLRVDAVSNMIYLDYGRNPGEWEPNIFGDRGNLEGIQFIKDFNKTIRTYCKGVITIAEESTSWKDVTKSDEEGGLGFTFKWNMGWMNDTLKYIEMDPIYRKYNHNKINFSMMYNYSENFILPISHDEVVHGKKSLLNKMHGDQWNKYSGLRLYATYMMAHPGKKLMFMGCEFGQFIEWREYEQLEWNIINEYDCHKTTHEFFKKLNHFYLENKALWEMDYHYSGFQWIDANNADQSIITFIRRGNNEEDTLIVICNFTPVVYYDFKIGVPFEGNYEQVFNTDSLNFGGSGQELDDTLYSLEDGCHNQPYSLKIKIPPNAALILKKVK